MLILSLHIVLKFKNIKLKGTCLPDLFERSGKSTKCHILISEQGFIAFTQYRIQSIQSHASRNFII